MARPHPSEARIDATRQVLVVLSPRRDDLLDGFFGAVVTDPAAGLPDLAGKAVYLRGDWTKAAALDLSAAARVLAIPDDAATDGCPWPVVDPGRAPIDVHGLGVYYRRFFEPGVDFAARILGEHSFQALTESTKPGTAHRTGIYLTPVRRRSDGLHFRLLRCSTNLSGPTDDFRATDRRIVDALAQEAALVFSGAAPLNHVLAQRYHNTPAEAAKKQAKARISSHADKTKDMPDHGVMVFCSFYERLDRLGPMPGDRYDRGHRGVSGLTRLRFRRKQAAAVDDGSPEQFTITLYPDSAFFMPLATNRRYTHELVPSELDAARLPTRLGYVVRCSKTEAVHADGRTYLLRDGARVELEPPTPEGMSALRRLYAEENQTTGFVDYGDGFRFSMNAGDYRAPIVAASDEFRAYPVRGPDDPFAALSASVPLEELGKGRRGAVLVADDPRGTPIVRTTAAYTLPARRFAAVHAALMREIQAAAALALPFNHGLLELYTREYATMGAHSDQALDLDDAGEIALYTCYRDPAAAPSRRLIVESKQPGGPTFDVPLRHGHVVVFSVDANRRFRHKIVLDPAAPDNPWLGLTLRAAKTRVHLRDGRPHLADGTPLTLADDEQRQEFYRLRRRENQEPDFVYPPIPYTLSPSDLWPPDAGVDGSP